MYWGLNRPHVPQGTQLTLGGTNLPRLDQSGCGNEEKPNRTQLTLGGSEDSVRYKNI
jgi:hypothetical protein